VVLEALGAGGAWARREEERGEVRWRMVRLRLYIGAEGEVGGR
jgi:hypothetical protein